LQTMLRNLGVTFFLVALAGPASATDQSAMEETNCLMACDANQQNCQATRQVSTERNYSFAQHSPPSKMKSAVVRSRQMISSRRRVRSRGYPTDRDRVVRHSKSGWSTSEMGQKQNFPEPERMSALPPEADVR
jgi:hypothetical protein